MLRQTAMLRIAVSLITLGLSAWWAPAAGDTAYLEDGSVINGEVQRLYEGELVMQTAFADELVIPGDKLAGVHTEQPMIVTTQAGDEVQARLRYDPERGQQIATEAFGASSKPVAQIVGLRRPGERDPKLVAAEQALAKAQADPWSGRVELGLEGASGNTEEENLSFRAKGLRETDGDRLVLATRLHKQSQNDVQTEDEFVALGRLERDWSERAFVFGETEVERDEFENIDLRFRATLGPGYFFLRQPDHTLKGRLGLGYVHESFSTGGNEGSAVATLGYDYSVVFFEWFAFRHDLTTISEIDASPSENFRLESVLAGELPLGAVASLWRLRAELRHEHDNNPEPGIEQLDTSYLLGVVREFE